MAADDDGPPSRALGPRRSSTRDGWGRRRREQLDASGLPRRGNELVDSRDDEGSGWNVELYGPYQLPQPPEPPMPRHARPGALNSVERAAYAELLWRMLYNDDQIAELVIEHFGPITRDVVDRDLKQIRKQYAAAERDPNAIATRKARMRSSMESLFQHSLAAGDRTSARFMLDRLCKLDGLLAPMKVELSNGANATNAALSLEKIVEALETDEELRAFEIVVAALERKGLQHTTHELGVNAIDVESDS